MEVKRLVRLLFRHLPEARRNDTLYFLICLRNYDEEKVIRTIMNDIEYLGSNSSEQDVLFLALCATDLTEIVGLMIARGYDVNTHFTYGVNHIDTFAIHIACASGKLDVVKFLINNGADVNTKNNQLMLPIHVACINGNAEMIDLLADLTRDLNTRDKHKHTPLHYAIEYDRDASQIIRLISNGADDKELTSSHVTMLMRVLEGQR